MIDSVSMKALYQASYDDIIDAESSQSGASGNQQDPAWAGRSLQSIQAQDKFVPSGERNAEIPGVYRIDKNQKGDLRGILSESKSGGTAQAKEDHEEDAPTTSLEASEELAESEKREKDTEVTLEIAELRRKKVMIEQQIASAIGNENLVNDLKRALSQIREELTEKDNASYRRQQTS